MVLNYELISINHSSDVLVSRRAVFLLNIKNALNSPSYLCEVCSLGLLLQG